MRWRSKVWAGLLVPLGLVACKEKPPVEPPPPRGSVQVRVFTVGGGIDGDGFTATVGTASAPVRDSTTFAQLPPADYSVRLSGVAPHCLLASDSALVSVSAGKTVSVDFTVRCAGDYLFERWLGGPYELRYMSRTGEQNLVAAAPIGAGSYSWSPDGAQVMFLRVVAGNVDLYLVRPDGTGLVRLTTSPDSELGPSWSRDGSRIAFRRPTAAGPELWTVRADGSDARRALLSPDPLTSNPAWAPPGNALAFTATFNGYIPLSIWSVGLDGTGLTNLSAAPLWDRDPAWSADGTRLAFVRAAPGTWALVVAGADGSGQRQLSISSGMKRPIWSPDGRRILFGKEIDGVPRTCTIAPDGSGEQVLAPELGLVAQPAWSADGRAILFSGPSGYLTGIYVMDVDGSRPQLLVAADAAAPTLADGPRPRPR